MARCSAHLQTPTVPQSKPRTGTIDSELDVRVTSSLIQLIHAIHQRMRKARRTAETQRRRAAVKRAFIRRRDCAHRRYTERGESLLRGELLHRFASERGREEALTLGDGAREMACGAQKMCRSTLVTLARTESSSPPVPTPRLKSCQSLRWHNSLTSAKSAPLSQASCQRSKV